MAATGYTPISLYYSSTASAVPSSGNLVAGELALNTADMKLYAKNSAGTVTLLASNASTSATVSSVAQTFTGGLITVAGSPVTSTGTLALTVAGTSGGLVYFSSSTTWESSSVLAANSLMIGGGAGAAPSTTTTGTGILTFLGTPSSANLAAAVTDETGSGSLVFGTAPTLSNTTNNGSFTEQTYTLGTSGSMALNPANGVIQTSTLSGNPTFTDSLSSGQSIVLMLNNGASYTVTWPTITWVTSKGNIAPTLTTKNTLVFWKVSTSLYGAYVGSGT